MLERACGLQQGFLRVQTDLPPAARSRGHTAGAEWTGRTERRVKVEEAPRRPRCGGRGIGAAPAHSARHLARRTGTSARRQVDLEILLGKVGPGRPFGHLGDQGPPGGGKLLAGVAIPIGRIRNGRGHRQPGVLLNLRHQLQRPQGIRWVAGAASPPP